MSEDKKKELVAIVVEVEAAKTVNAALTGLCSNVNLGSPARQVLEKTLTTIKSVDTNLTQALPSNRRIACLRLQRAGKLTSSKRSLLDPDHSGSHMKKCRVLADQPTNVVSSSSEELRTLPNRQVHGIVCTPTCVRSLNHIL